jgi:hypothetical protein
MIDERPALRICLRDDDVCGPTSVALLERLRGEVWEDRPITEAVIPHVGSTVYDRRNPFGAEGVRERDIRENARLIAHLRREVEAGLAEVAVHGVTHLDHPAAGRFLAEFEVPVDSHVERLVAECKALHRELGASFFVPPHNAAHPDVAAACLRAGFDVCRSMSADEVREVAGNSDRRDEAKRMQPYRFRGEGLEVFQTMLLSKDRIVRKGWTAAQVARDVLAIAEHTGMAVITLHWWDFTTDGTESWDPSYARWMQDFLAAVESQVAGAGRTPVYNTLSSLAAALRSGRCPSQFNEVIQAVHPIPEASGVS